MLSKVEIKLSREVSNMYNKLGKISKNSKNSFELKLFNSINKALDKLKNDPLCGKHISKKQIPRKLFRIWQIKNLWKYDLVKGWRILYTLDNMEVKIEMIILSCTTHKDYNRLMKY